MLVTSNDSGFNNTITTQIPRDAMHLSPRVARFLKIAILLISNSCGIVSRGRMPLFCRLYFYTPAGCP